MKLRSLALCSLLICLLSMACGEDEERGSGISGSGAGSSSSGSATCSGSFAILQKDAYKETAGRSTELWPPHTTTELSYSCTDSTTTSYAFQANHGTEPSDVDASGEPFLVNVGEVSVSGSFTQLEDLRAAYEACECSTQFLSMDALGDQAVQDLVAALSDYITMNLTCSGMVDAMGLVGLLQMGEIEAVIAELPNCSWSGGAGWEGGFDEALGAIISAAMETLDDYHVCNNDAVLQANLIDAYARTGDVVPCNGDDPVCHGPLWFYSP